MPGGRWCYLYRAIDSAGALVDVLFSEHRDMKAAKAFFRSAKTVTGITPDRVTTDGHDSHPRAVRTELGKAVRHRTSRYLNNRLEQDHRGIKGRYRPMRASSVQARRHGSVEGTTNCATFSASGPATTSMFPPPAVDFAFSVARGACSPSCKQPDRLARAHEINRDTCWHEP